MKNLLLICGINAGIGLTIIYAIAYSWIADGLDQLELSFLAILSGLIFLGSTAILDTWALSYYRKEVIVDGKKPLKFGYLFLILAVGTIILSGLVDFLFHSLVDNTIATVYGKSLKELMSQDGVLASPEEADSFIMLPFFVQNVAVNIIGIIVGILLAIPLSKALLKITMPRVDPTQA